VLTVWMMLLSRFVQALSEPVVQVRPQRRSGDLYRTWPCNDERSKGDEGEDGGGARDEDADGVVVTLVVTMGSWL
jgi:hypothetical protein